MARQTQVPQTNEDGEAAYSVFASDPIIKYASRFSFNLQINYVCTVFGHGLWKWLDPLYLTIAWNNSINDGVSVRTMCNQNVKIHAKPNILFLVE